MYSCIKMTCTYFAVYTSRNLRRIGKIVSLQALILRSISKTLLVAISDRVSLIPTGLLLPGPSNVQRRGPPAFCWPRQAILHEAPGICQTPALAHCLSRPACMWARCCSLLQAGKLTVKRQPLKFLTSLGSHLRKPLKHSI